MRPVTKKVTKEFYIKSIAKAQNHIVRNLDERPNADELAKIVGISKYHFHKIFLSMTGETIHQYVRRKRLELAIVELHSSNKSVIEIAFNSGYETHESFSRAFKKHFDYSPKDIKKISHDELIKIITDNKPEQIFLEKNMEVTIKNYEDVKVVYVRHNGPYYECGKAWEKLHESQEIISQIDMNTLCMGLGYDDAERTAPDKIRYDACISIKDESVIPEGFDIKTVEGGKFAVHRHIGSYTGLAEKYQWIYGVWLPDSERQLRPNPAMEIYVNSPTDTDEDKLITDICIPIE